MRVLLTSQSPQAVQPLRPVVNGLGLECDATDCVSFDNLRFRLTTEPPADLLVVQAGEDQVAAMLAVQQGAAARLPVVAVAPQTETGLCAQLTRAGARHLVDEGRFREGLQVALEQFYQDGTFRTGRGKVLAFTAAQGGSGATTAAMAVGFALGQIVPGRVVIGEMSGEAPEMAIDLDLKVTLGLADLARNWERSDPHMVRQVAVAHPLGAHVLANSPEPFRVPPIEPAVMRHLVVLLREMYEHLVLDLGPNVQGGQLEAARLAEVVVVVVRPDVPSLRLARTYVRHLRDLGIPKDRIRAVGNRTGYSRQVARDEAEKALGLPLAEWVADDVNTVAGALAVGQPLAQYYSWATITSTFGRLARSLAGVKA